MHQSETELVRLETCLLFGDEGKPLTASIRTRVFPACLKMVPMSLFTFLLRSYSIMACIQEGACDRHHISIDVDVSSRGNVSSVQNSFQKNFVFRKSGGAGVLKGRSPFLIRNRSALKAAAYSRGSGLGKSGKHMKLGQEFTALVP